jgi:hypothetical protein
MATAVQGSFVGRTKSIQTTGNAYGKVVQVVGASTTFHATGSNVSTAFMVHTGTNYTLTPVNDGSATIVGGTNPVTANEIYPISLRTVTNGGSTVVTLLR